MEKKCTHCGSTKLVRENYSFTDSADMSMPIDIYVCEECGHIELFENPDKGLYKKNNKPGKLVV